MVVSLLPDDFVEIREERTQRKYSLPLADGYEHLVQSAVRARERSIAKLVRELVAGGVGRREATRVAKQDANG